MNELQRFNFDGNQLRSMLIDNDPWFVAKDLCDFLELNNVSQAVNRLDDDEKNTIILNEGIGNPEKVIINESGLYSLILGSRKPEAKAFKKWVTNEVLPAIRKTGKYEVKTLSPTEIILQAAQQLHEQSLRMDSIEEKVRVIEASKETNDGGYVAIMGYARLVNKPIDVGTAAKLGRKAKSICSTLGYEVYSVSDPRFGRVNTYPKEVLETVFNDHFK